MFKKLKQKISEEQQQQQQQLASPQTSSNTSTPTRDRSRTSSFTEQVDEGTPNREKPQLRGPFMESLFGNAVKESLSRSPPMEPLVQTFSRGSLTTFDSDAVASDLEGEAEDSGDLENLSRGQLIQRLRRMQQSLKNCSVKHREIGP